VILTDREAGLRSFPAGYFANTIASGNVIQVYFVQLYDFFIGP
jgi:hypothetical protein